MLTGVAIGRGLLINKHSATVFLILMTTLPVIRLNTTHILVGLPAPQAILLPRSGTRFGVFQILFGVDYAVTEAMSLGLKGRWVKFNSFSDNLSWNPLRSHAPLHQNRQGNSDSGKHDHLGYRVFRYQREHEVSFLGNPSSFFRRPWRNNNRAG